MNRQWTGWLAWCALAVIVAVPSADIVFSQPETTPSVVVADVERQPFIGPMPVDPERTTDPFQGPVLETIESVKVPDPVKVMEPAIVLETPLVLPDTPPVIEVAEPSPLLTDKIKPVPLAPTIPLDFRIVGDQRMVTALRNTNPVPAETSENVVAVDNEALSETPLVEVVPEVENLETVVVANSDPDASALPITGTIVAPIPMPVALRPASPAGQRNSLEDDVRLSIETIRTARQGNSVVELRPDDRDNFLAEDVAPSRGLQRLDRIDRDSFSRDDYAGDSAFYELWEEENRPSGFSRRGSFEEQLPARRGRSVRLDLVQ